MKKRFQAVALWCMTYIQELIIIAMLTLFAGGALIYMAGPVLTKKDIILVFLVNILGFLPVLVGGLYEFHLSIERWFGDDKGRGKS